MKKILLLVGLTLSIKLSAQVTNGGLTDRDGNIYKTVLIDKLAWMAENLNTQTFQNGDIITHAKTKSEWTNAEREGIPAWCYYANDENNGQKYGKLYNWFAVTDSRGLAPEGWHIPSKYEWQSLIDFFGGVDRAGYKLKSEIGWKKTYGTSAESMKECLNYDEKGFSIEGFNALPGGRRIGIGYARIYDAEFNSICEDAVFWTSTMSEVNFKGWSLTIENYGEIRYTCCDAGYGYSIRCVR